MAEFTKDETDFIYEFILDKAKEKAFKTIKANVETEKDKLYEKEIILKNENILILKPIVDKANADIEIIKSCKSVDDLKKAKYV